MGILPKIIETSMITPLKTTTVTDNKFKKTYIIDFQNKQLKYFDGVPVVDNEELATKMYIQKLLLTDIDDWLLYKNYFTNYRNLTHHKKFNNSIIKIEIERNLREQLLKYYDIVAVENLEIKQNYTTLFISFSVRLLNNQIISWEKAFNI